MIRQHSHQYQQQQQQQQRGTMPPPPQRLVMTAPRPRIHRLLNEEDGSSSMTGSELDEDVIRTNLFAQPAVVQNDIFRQGPQLQTRVMGVAKNYHERHQIYQQPNKGLTRSGANRMAAHVSSANQRAVRRTPSKDWRAQASRQGHHNHYGRSGVKRTGNDDFCGLSAEISREIAYRTTPKKTPTKTPTKTPMKTPGKGIMAPLSRDLFRAKTPAAPAMTSPMANSALLNMQNIQLTQTTSMSSSSDGGSSPRDLFARSLPNQQPGAASTKPQPAAGKKNETAQKNKARRHSVGGSATKTPRPVRTEKKKIGKTPFPGLSARKRLKKCLTPPRKNFGSHMKNSSSRTSLAAQVTLSMSYSGVNDFRLTGSEVDPSPFQVELPAKKEIAVHSKICALMDGYTAIHRDFNFAMLSGVSHSTLQKEVAKSTDEKPMIVGSCHRDVVQQLLDCAEDIVVEGFFREYMREEEGKESDRVEACILSSECSRQIIVCFRGSTANQAKPLGKGGMFGKEVTAILHEEQPVPVLASLRSTYFGTQLERTAFALLANLAARKPFFDVVMTGHSFGAAVAAVASMRYAFKNSQMRVSCHVFGCPRIGGEEWRQRVNSIPNLRVYRVENGCDPYVSLPAGNEWVHCGHAIRIAGDGDDVEFTARRFDRDAAASANAGMLGFVQAKVVGSMTLSQGSSVQGRLDHEIGSYDMRLARSGDAWFDDFCEMRGKGIRANDNESRTLA